jgi:hypothetical protein
MSMYDPYPEENSLSWHGRLGQATTEPEVLAVAREFLATVTPYEVARLPEPLRPPKLTDASDVSAYAIDLVRMDLGGALATQRALPRLANFFSRASTRLSTIFAAHVLHAPPEGGLRPSPGAD